MIKKNNELKEEAAEISNSFDIKFIEVERSYDRVKDNPDFFDFFYHALFAADKAIFDLFKKTNMNSQKQALRDSIQYMLMLNAGSQIANRKFDALAVTHDREHRNIKPDLYEYWVKSLLKSLAAFDPKFNSSLEELWRGAVAVGINRMTSKY